MLTVDYDKFDVRAGDLLLDLGCGFGRHTYEALVRGADVVSCDMALPELEAIRNTAPMLIEDGLFDGQLLHTQVQGDGTRLPFPDNTFDKIIASEVLEHILHKLHLAPLLILPIAKWRPVFDLVTPALTENEQWISIDSEASIEMNTRDPLVCEPRDLHLLRAVVEVVLGDGEEMAQGISIAAIQAPVLVEVEPAGGVLLTIGNEGLADEVRAVADAFNLG